MKLNSVKLTAASERRKQAFTLIEMIGVLAVIAILAAMLIPRVFEAINSARVNNSVVSTETCKTASADHYGKYGKFDLIFGTNQIPAGSFVGGIYAGYDTNVLMPEGLLDKPFSPRIAGGDPVVFSALQLVQTGSENGGLATGYELDGATRAGVGSQYFLECVIKNVAAADAKDMNDRIDGGSLGVPNLTAADTRGRVEYAAPVGGVTTVYIYLSHR